MTLETMLVRPDLLVAIAARPLAWPAVMAVAGGAVVLGRALKRHEEARALGASAAIVGRRARGKV